MIKKFLLASVFAFFIASIGQVAQAHHGHYGHHGHARPPMMHHGGHHHMVRHHRPPRMHVYSGYRVYNPVYYGYYPGVNVNFGYPRYPYHHGNFGVGFNIAL